VLASFGLGANSEAISPLIGFAAVVVLFLTVSIPMIERRLEQDKGAYGSYKRHTPTLLPRPSFRR
jgi:protein-S-isoprenylcysteine O-methyltransferase Ste14